MADTLPNLSAPLMQPELVQRIESEQHHVRMTHASVVRLTMGIAVLLAVFLAPFHGLSGKIYKHSEDAFGTAIITLAFATLYFGRYHIFSMPSKPRDLDCPESNKLVYSMPKDGGNGRSSIKQAVGPRLNIFAYCRFAKCMLPAVVNLVGFTAAVFALPERDADKALNLSRYVVAWFELTIVWLSFLLEVLPWSVRLMLLPQGEVPAMLLSRQVFYIRFMASFSATALLAKCAESIPSRITSLSNVCADRLNSKMGPKGRNDVESTDGNERRDNVSDSDCSADGVGEGVAVGDVMSALWCTAWEKYQDVVFLLLDISIIMPLTVSALLVKMSTLRFTSEITAEKWSWSHWIALALFLNNVLHIDGLAPDNVGRTAGLRRLRELVKFLNADTDLWVYELYRNLASLYGNMGAVVAMLSLTEDRAEQLVDLEKRRKKPGFLP